MARKYKTGKENTIVNIPQSQKAIWVNEMVNVPHQIIADNCSIEEPLFKQLWDEMGNAIDLLRIFGTRLDVK